MTVPGLLRLPFPAMPDLAASMDIQIPALAWQPVGDGRYHRAVHVDDRRVDVVVDAHADVLRFTTDTAVDDRIAAALARRLRATFPEQVGGLRLGDEPILRELRTHYRGVIVMWADPFEALVLTVLSQNRSGETVRRVFADLASACDGATAAHLAALGEQRLRQVIRSAGPYKAPRLAAVAAHVADIGEAAFADRVVSAPTDRALAYLTALPGVGHKTAACVLAFSARTRETLPVDTHLFRVVDRLGLAQHTGRHNTTTRDAIIAALLSRAPDLALAHFLFLLVGRSTCTATAPACPGCFLRPHCRHAHDTSTPTPSEDR